jgi:hypothetical protein
MQFPAYLQDSTIESYIKLKYPHFKEVFPKNGYYQTKLPLDIFLIQVLAGYALSALGNYLSSSPLMYTGLSMIGVTVYNNFLGKDPLGDTFYKIVGGVDNFKKIPKIHFRADNPLVDQIVKINWDELKFPVYRAITDDGRLVVIVKSAFAPCDDVSVKRVFAFIEKLGPRDFKPTRTNVPAILSNLVNSFAHAFFLRESDYGYGSIHEKCFGLRNVYIRSYITSDMANEFAAQTKHLFGD